MLGGEVDRLLRSLGEREREILRLRYGLDRGEPRTLEEVGAELSLTRERIRQIERSALAKLRHPLHNSGARGPHRLLASRVRPRRIAEHRRVLHRVFPAVDAELDVHMAGVRLYGVHRCVQLIGDLRRREVGRRISATLAYAGR